MKTKNKSSLSLGDAFPSILIVCIISILMIAILYLFGQFGSTFTEGSAARNATESFSTQFINQIPLVGLILTIVMIAIVIGVLITSFFVGQEKRV